MKALAVRKRCTWADDSSVSVRKLARTCDLGIIYIYIYICSFRHGGSCMRWGWMVVFRLTAGAFQTCPLWDCLGGLVSEEKRRIGGSGGEALRAPIVGVSVRTP